MTDLKQLLIDIVRGIVSNPDAVCVTESVGEAATSLTLTVAPDDMGRVIGKNGRVANSIRVVMKAAAIARNVRINVEIRDAE